MTHHHHHLINIITIITIIIIIINNIIIINISASHAGQSYVIDYTLYYLQT